MNETGSFLAKWWNSGHSATLVNVVSGIGPSNHCRASIYSAPPWYRHHVSFPWKRLAAANVSVRKKVTTIPRGVASTRSRTTVNDRTTYCLANWRHHTISRIVNIIGVAARHWTANDRWASPSDRLQGRLETAGDVCDPGYMSRKVRKFRTYKFDTRYKRTFWLM